MIYWEVSVQCVALLTDFYYLCLVTVEWLGQLLAPLTDPSSWAPAFKRIHTMKWNTAPDVLEPSKLSLENVA